jgi:hypothetical protein
MAVLPDLKTGWKRLLSVQRMESSPKSIRFYNLNYGVIPMHYKYICILALTALKMAS